MAHGAHGVCRVDSTVTADHQWAYCSPRWISDHNFNAIMNYRGFTAAAFTANAADQDGCPSRHNPNPTHETDLAASSPPELSSHVVLWHQTILLIDGVVDAAQKCSNFERRVDQLTRAASLDIYMSIKYHSRHMIRTTVRLPEELLDAAKARASATGRSFTDLLADSLRYELQRPVTPARVHEPLPTYRGQGLQAGVDLSDASALEDLMSGR